MSGNLAESIVVRFLESLTPSNISSRPSGSPSQLILCSLLANLGESPLLRGHSALPRSNRHITLPPLLIPLSQGGFSSAASVSL